LQNPISVGFRRSGCDDPSEPIQVLEDSPPDCSGVLGDTRHFHIDLYGDYIPGLSSEHAVDMRGLRRPLPKETYPLLHRLATKGVCGLYELAAERFGYAPHRNAFLNPCDLCTDIRNFLFRRTEDSFSELAPAGFYEEPKRLERSS